MIERKPLNSSETNEKRLLMRVVSTDKTNKGFNNCLQYTPREMQSLLESGNLPSHSSLTISEFYNHAKGEYLYRQNKYKLNESRFANGERDEDTYLHNKKHYTLSERAKNDLEAINQCIDNMVKAVSKGIQTGNYASLCVSLDFSHIEVRDTGAKELATLLEHPACPKELTLDLPRSKITSDGAIALATAIKKNSFSKLHLNLSRNLIEDQGIEAIMGIISVAPAHIILNLDYMIKDHHLIKLSEALQSKSAPDKFSCSLSHSPISSTGFGYLCSALKSGLCKKNISLSLCNSEIDESWLEELGNVLESGKCPSHLTISLMSFNNNKGIGDKGAAFLAKGLRSGKAPSHFTLHLYDQLFGLEGHRAIADSLASGHCPNGLKLSVSLPKGQEITALQFYLTALETGNCPAGLQLHIGHKELSPEAEEMIVRTIQSGKCPPGFQILNGLQGFKKPIKSMLEQIENELKANSVGCYIVERDAKKFHSKLNKIPDIRKEIYKYLIPACHDRTQNVFFKNVIEDKLKLKVAEKKSHNNIR